MSDPASISNEAIEIAGTKSFTKNANTIGAAKFTVTLCAAGTDTVQASASGASTAWALQSALVRSSSRTLVRSFSSSVVGRGLRAERPGRQ